MTVWGRRHFTRPYLASTVHTGAGGGEVELRDGERAMSLTVDGEVEAARSLLTELTEPGSEAWQYLDRHAPPPLVELVADLDRHGWLREADDAGRRRLAERADRLDDLVDRSARWLDGWKGRDGAPRPGNQALPVLAACRQAWRRSSPLTEQVLEHVLDGVPAGRRRWDPVAIVVCDVGDVEQQVWAALQLAVMSRSDALASRYRRFVPPSMADGPGVNVLVTAEHRAEALLADLGEPELHRLIAEPGGADRVAPVVFQHRWFETVRYVEAAAGLLRFRLGAGLRDLAARYLREEMGHEVHEAHTCRELGVTDPDLAEFAPLAWFAAYPELLGDLAERRPLSFLLAMTVAEGLPGSGRRLTELLVEHRDGGDDLVAHDEIDRQLNHEMVTRTFLSQLDWVSGPSACEAIADLLRIVELAHAGWQMLSRYVAAGLPVTPRPFGMTADVVGELCATPPRPPA